MGFNCDICLRVCRSLGSLKRHKRVSHKIFDKTYKCCECHFEGDSAIAILRHNQRTHSRRQTLNQIRIANGLNDRDNSSSDSNHNVASFQCEICQLELCTSPALTLHKKKKHNITGTKFRCNECKFSSDDEKNVSTHIRRMHGKRILLHEIRDPSWAASNEENQEITAVNPGNQVSEPISEANACTFKCDVCPRLCRSLKNLNQHKRMAHGIFGSNYCCNDCKLSTNSGKSLQVHYRKIHLKRIPIAEIRKMTPAQSILRTSDSTTIIAEKRSSSSKKIKKTAPETLQCVACPRTFTSIKGLKFHERQKHDIFGTKYHCKNCKYSSDEKKNLKDHYRKRHKLYVLYSDIVEHACTDSTTETCTSKNSTGYDGGHNQESSTTTLSTRKTYECDICSIVLPSLHGLKIHKQKIHKFYAGKYRCTECEYATDIAEYMQRHYKRKNHMTISKIKVTSIAANVDCNPNYLRKIDNKQVCTTAELETTKIESSETNKDFSYLENMEKVIGKSIENSKKKCDVQISRIAADDSTSIFECDACAKIFNSKRALSVHARAVHGKMKRTTFTCDACPDVFGTLLTLMNHRNIRHKYPVMKFYCPECKYTSKIDTYLQGHLRRIHKIRLPIEDIKSSYNTDMVVPSTSTTGDALENKQNKDKVAEEAVTITQTISPTLTSAFPARTFFVPGISFFLSVEVKGSLSGSKVSWRHNGNEIDPLQKGYKYNVLRGVMHSLEIKDSSKDHEGEWTFEFSNKAGSLVIKTEAIIMCNYTDKTKCIDIQESAIEIVEMEENDENLVPSFMECEVMEVL